MPKREYLLVTFFGLSNEIIQGIFKIRNFDRSGDPVNTPCMLDVLVYGTDVPMLLGSSRAVPWSIAVTSIIEYKSLDIFEAPLFINWYWLSSSMKRELFSS
jgi:hypothetical protein